MAASVGSYQQPHPYVAYTIDVVARRIDVDASDAEIVERQRSWRAPKQRYTSGVFVKYAALVQSASDGAITRLA